MGRRPEDMRTEAPLAPDLASGAGGACRAERVLQGFPIECIDVAGKAIDVSEMGPACVCSSRSAGVVDRLEGAQVAERQRTWRVRSDAAQVVATYLRCHPAVREVRYPGLKDDPSYALASVTLQGGFGPYVDYRTDAGWERHVATEADAREQVMALERALGARVGKGAS